MNKRWLLLAGIVAAMAIFFALTRETALVLHPKGVMARSELRLLVIQLVLMLLVIVPTFAFLFLTVNKRREPTPVRLKQTVLWLVPTAVVAVMSLISWDATHKLDPYKPISSDVKPLYIQVVALDWKWLFIYPQQRIATVNFVQFPANTPIQLSLAADNSPMNSFWIPELSGQIYSMTGMSTSLHFMADGPGSYPGRAAEINGEGYADMTFVATSSTTADFEDWVASVQTSPLQLTQDLYNELVKPSIKHPVTLYSDVENNLYQQIMRKY